MKEYCFQIQFGHNGVEDERTMTLFITRKSDKSTYNIRTKVYDILLSKELNLEIKTHPKYTGHITVIIKWNDIYYYVKNMIYNHNFTYSMISLSSGYIEEDEIIKIAEKFIFINDNNRQEEIDKLCEILLYKKDTIYKWEHDNMENQTNIEYCKEFGSDKFKKQYSHIFNAKNFDII